MAMSEDPRNSGLWQQIHANRNAMKCPNLDAQQIKSDQVKRLPQPPLAKPAEGALIELPPFDGAVTTPDYMSLLTARRSVRVYDKEKSMSAAQLAFLLWSVQSVQYVRGKGYAAMRPVPSGGARHAFETYVAVRNVDGLAPGVYHYAPMANVGERRVSVARVDAPPIVDETLVRMLEGQSWAQAAQAVVFFSCAAYRAEWRYNIFAHRVVLIDLGHVGQNLMLSAAAMGLGSCCLAAFDQTLCDEILKLDGQEEYTVYACPVGCPKPQDQ